MKTDGKLEELPLASITLDKRLQMRPTLNEAVVERYSEVLSENVSMPPAVVFFDGSTYWLADGFHRYFASKKAECETLYSDVRSGTFRDAFRFALSANGDNGLPRDADTIESVMRAALGDEEIRGESDRAISVLCNVSAMTVGRWRKKLEKSGTVTPVTVRKGTDGKARSVSTVTPVTVEKPNKKQAEPQWVGDDEPVLTAEDWKAAETEKDKKGHAKSYLRGASKSLAALQDNCTQAARYGAKIDLEVVDRGARMIYAVIEQGGKSL